MNKRKRSTGANKPKEPQQEARTSNQKDDEPSKNDPKTSLPRKGLGLRERQNVSKIRPPDNPPPPPVVDLLSDNSEEECNDAGGRGMPSRKTKRKSTDGGGQGLTSVSKKKRLDEATTTSRNSATKIKSVPVPTTAPTTPLSVEPADSEMDEDTPQVEFMLARGDDNNDQGSSQYLTPAASSSSSSSFSFKRPAPPPRPRLYTKDLTVKKGTWKTPTESQLQNTQQARETRSAFVGVIQDYFLDDISDASESHIEHFIQNMKQCTDLMPHVFAPRRYLCHNSDELEDLSPDCEVEQFARWWFFGLTSLLFSPSTEHMKRRKDEIKYLLGTLCQFLQYGHPTVVDNMMEQLLKVLTNVVTNNGTNEMPELKICLELELANRNEKEKKTFIININQETQWAIPHFLEAVSFVFPRMFSFHPHLTYAVVELMRRLDGKFQSDTIKTVIPTLLKCAIPAVPYLTERGLGNMIKSALKSPNSTKLHIDHLRALACQYGIFHHIYDDFLGESETIFIRSYDATGLRPSAILEKTDMCVVDIQPFFVENNNFHVNVSSEVVKFSKLVQLVGLNAVHHPLFASVLLMEFRENMPATLLQRQPEATKAHEISRVWNTITSRWDPKKYPTSVPPNPAEILTFLENFRALVKFTRKVKEKLTESSPSATTKAYDFFELEQIQYWISVALAGLLHVHVLDVTQSYQLYGTVLETIELFDNLYWFGVRLSLNLITNLLLIAGWPWLEQHQLYLLKAVNPLPEFTRNNFSKGKLADSMILVAKAVRTLRMSIFRPWVHFVDTVYRKLISAESTMMNAFLVTELLNGIADVSWPFHGLGLEFIFTFLIHVVENDKWKTDAYLRSSLGKAVAALPCICCYNLNAIQSDTDVRFPTGGCEICMSEHVELRERNSLPATNLTLLSASLTEKIMMLAAPLLTSKFLLVKMHLTDLIVRCNNHMQVPSPIAAQPFIQVAVQGKACLSDEIFDKIGTVLAQTTDLNHSCFDRLNVAVGVFRPLPSVIARARSGKVTQGILCKILRGFLKLATHSLSTSTFVEVIKCMLFFLAWCDKTEVVLLSKMILERYASVIQCKPFELMSRVRHDVSLEIIQVARKFFFKSGVSKKMRVERAQKCADFFGVLELTMQFRSHIKTFHRWYFPSMLEEIVPKLHLAPDYGFLLLAMSLNFQDDEKIILQDSIMHFYPTLLLDHSLENVTKCLKHLKSIYMFDAMFAAMQQEQKVWNETLCRLDDRREKVLRCIQHLCKWDEASLYSIYSTPSNHLPRSEMQDLLQGKLLGFFLHFDTKLHSKGELIETKRKILRSVTALIQIVGKSKIVPHRAKVYKTLNSIAKEGPVYFDVLLDAWKAFAANLDNSNFGSMAAPILAAILPLRESDLRTQVDGFISHFVCLKQELTSPHMKELYFLADHCDVQEVKDAINGVTNAMKSAKWLDYFDFLVEMSANDNSHLRFQAVKQLLHIIKYDSDTVEKQVLSKGWRSTSKVLTNLLAGLRSDMDEKLQQLIGECFGCLGALDPIRFYNGPAEDRGSKIRVPVATSRMAVTFVVPYIQELIREFQEAKDTTTFDYCACLIQEVLKEFRVETNSEDAIWKELSPTSQELITPMFSTKYQVESVSPMPNLPTPIYLSEHGRTFESWLFNWLTLLISYITEEQSQAHSLFNNSKGLLRHNVRIQGFLMPYVAIYATMCCTSEQCEKIALEIKTVLERWTALNAKRNKAHNAMPIKDSQAEIGFAEDQSIEEESAFHLRCTQIIFNVLDHLLRAFKLSKRKWGLRKATEQFRGHGPNKTYSPPLDENTVAAIEIVLKNLSLKLISQVAYSCESYHCALYYLEQELRLNPSKEKLQENLGNLQRIYVSLQDLDSVIGVTAVRNGEPPLCEDVLESIALGKIEDSVKKLEHMTAVDPSDLIAHNALMQAYLSIEEPWKTQVLLGATLERQPEWEVAFQEVQLESIVKLRNWSELQDQVDQMELTFSNPVREEKALTWNIAIARAISKIACSQFDEAFEVVEKVRGKIITPLVTASEELHQYYRRYYNVVQLHILDEVEDAVKLLKKHSQYMSSGKGQGALYQEIKRLLAKWDTRLRNASNSRKVIDQITFVRKSILEIMKDIFCANEPVCGLLSNSVRECWLDMAREASKCGSFAHADNALLEAKKYLSPKVFIEEAKILTRKGHKERAISILHRGLDQYFPNRKPHIASSTDNKNVSSSLIESQILCSKAMLLLAKLSEEQKLFNMEDYIAKYTEAAEVYKESEKNLFTLGSYLERLYLSEQKDNRFEWQASVVRYYSQSLLYGCKYVYQSLPRLLSIWFDFAACMVESGSSAYAYSSSDASNSTIKSSMEPENILGNMNTSIRRMVAGIPTYILMTAFTQLISRLCHQNKGTWALLKDIIVGIICAHPHQALWMTMSVTKSVNKMRRNRCLEIYKIVEVKKPHLKSVIKNYTLLAERLIELCNKNIDRNLNQTSLNLIHKTLPNLINNPSFGEVSVPFQVFLSPTLPLRGLSHKDHDPFPENVVTIKGVDDTVDVMPSLIRPKKIVLRGSNGMKYGLMCKPKDDLRKDSKVMEVNNVVNWYLSKNAESSQRRLYVKTFCVVPLNEECGILEWVPNIQGMRPIINLLYKEKGLGGDSREARALIQIHEPLETKKQKFVQQLLPQHPPVFHEWFFNNFHDHQSWYAARMSYMRTAAVMSMVGYIMGLGDRHGENILLDTRTGEVIHVDFNCIFNKGESFEWGERVPFRLTHNMVDAMGPLGYQGVFKRSCEVVMNTFRENKSIFLSVLRPFVFDPLVEWGRLGKRGPGIAATVETGEVRNEKAEETMKYIRHRLNGTGRNRKEDINTELSVEAMVKYLIDEATSIDNLCRMYPGWAAFV